MKLIKVFIMIFVLYDFFNCSRFETLTPMFILYKPQISNYKNLYNVFLFN